MMTTRSEASLYTVPQGSAIVEIRAVFDQLHIILDTQDLERTIRGPVVDEDEMRVTRQSPKPVEKGFYRLRLVENGNDDVDAIMHVRVVGHATHRKGL